MKSSVTRAPRAGIAMDFITPDAGLDAAVTVTLAQIPDRAGVVVFPGKTESKLASGVTGGKKPRRGVLQHGYIVCARYGLFRGVGKGSCRREAGNKTADCVGARLEKQRHGAGGVRTDFSHRRDL